MENLQTALLLLAVGMLTVFLILLTVICLGKLLIFLVNKYAPEEAPVKKAIQRTQEVPAHILAAITAAVNVVTHKKGKIVKVEKKN